MFHFFEVGHIFCATAHFASPQNLQSKFEIEHPKFEIKTNPKSNIRNPTSKSVFHSKPGRYIKKRSGS